MCGLIAELNTKVQKKKKIIKPKDANRFTIDPQQEQFQRGTKGYGILRINQKNKSRSNEFI